MKLVRCEEQWGWFLGINRTRRLTSQCIRTPLTHPMPKPVVVGRLIERTNERALRQGMEGRIGCLLLLAMSTMEEGWSGSVSSSEGEGRKSERGSRVELTFPKDAPNSNSPASCLTIAHKQMGVVLLHWPGPIGHSQPDRSALPQLPAHRCSAR
jgi:hypothetical protein